jgi:hypothetical protein
MRFARLLLPLVPAQGGTDDQRRTPDHCKFLSLLEKKSPGVLEGSKSIPAMAVLRILPNSQVNELR